MSLLFSCVCNQPERLMIAIEPVRRVLTTREVARWGLGYVQAGEVLLSRHPRMMEGEFDFFSVLDDLATDYLIGLASSADGYRGNANTQPFRYQQWMFAQDCTVTDSHKLHGELLSLLPGFLRQNLKGKSLPEYTFHLFLSHLHETSTLGDPNLPCAVIADALTKTLSLLQHKADSMGLEGSLGNLVVSNSRSMTCVRLDSPMYMRTLRHQFDPKRRDTEFRSAFVVSGASDVAEGFEELPANSILSIGRDVHTDISTLSP